MNLARAIARLSYVNGSLVSEAERAATIERYGYQPAPDNADCWLLQDDPEAGVGLEFDAQGLQLTLFGASQDNITNANYILQHCGWFEAELDCLDAARGDALLRSLNSMSLVQINGISTTEALGAPAVEGINPPAADMLGTAELCLADDQQQIEQLTMQLAAAESRAAQLEEENRALDARCQALAAQARTGAPVGAPAANGQLLSILEDLLVQQLDLSANVSLLNKLQAAGYRLKVQLVAH